MNRSQQKSKRKRLSINLTKVRFQYFQYTQFERLRQTYFEELHVQVQICKHGSKEDVEKALTTDSG